MRFTVRGIKNWMARFFSLTLSMCILFVLLVSPAPASFASNGDELVDIKAHWAETVIREWVSQGLIKGYGNGRFGPNDSISRAEFVTLLNRIFCYTQKSNVSFPDVKKDAWYAGEIAKAYQSGVIKGDSNGSIKPEAVISRQEAAVMLTRAFSLVEEYAGDALTGTSSGASPSNDNISDALKYADHKQIADWALDSVGTMTKKGYVSGRPGNLFAPKNDLSRSEAVKMIDNVMGELINSSGTYTKTVNGNMVVSSKDVTLNDAYIAGDLYLTDGIGQDTIRLIGVTVKGRTIISGTPSGKVIVLNGDFGEIVIESPGAVVTVESGAVGRFVVGKTAAGAVITAKDGTLIEELITYAGADITGGKNIKNAVIASGGVTMDEKPQNVIIADGGKAVSYKPGSDDTVVPGGGGPSGGGSSKPKPDPDDGDPDDGDPGDPDDGDPDDGDPEDGDPDDGDPDDGDPDDGDLESVDNIEQYGVTWYFDKKYEYGQFANGDYWVIGPVKVIRISPETTEDPGMNGSMINPVLSSVQGYDDRSTWAPYDPELNAAIGISSSNPLVIQPGSSLVSSISKPSVEKRPIIETAAVLTILDKAPPTGSFRPPYTGTDKSIKYNISQLNYQLLQNLAPTSSIPKVSSVIAMFERPWIDHAISGPMAQFINPDLNIGGYGAVISPKTSLGLLMANTNIPAEQKEKLVISMVQAGIDLYELYMDRATSRWAGGGGHNTGRLGMILFAGMMLQDEGMMDIYGAFQEVDQTYYGDGWSGATVLWRGRNLPEFEYEEKHPSEWTVDGRGEPGDPKAGSNSDMRVENYRQCCNAHTWVGTALAFRLMNGMTVWDHPAYFDYIDRWMTEDWSSYADVIREETGNSNYYYNQGSTSHKFITEMWNDYRDSAPFVSVYPKSGRYSQPIEVQLYCEDPGAQIYYTLDGTEPTQSSELYTSSLIINQKSILKTRAFGGNGEESPVSVVEYQIEDKQPPKVENICYDPDTNKISICFNEKVSEEGLEISSFSLSSDNSITSVNLQEDKKTVILETTSLDISQKHTISISGIKDLMDPVNIVEKKSYEIKINKIYEEDFEDETALDWQYISPDKWVLQEDEGDTSLRLKSSSYSPERKPGVYVTLKDADFKDFVLELDGKLTDAISDNHADFCVIFSYQNNDDYYFVSFSRIGSEAGIFKVDGKTKHQLISIDPIASDNSYHRVKVSVVDNMITVFVDGEFKTTIQNRVQNGSIGFGTMNDPAIFDNVRIKRLN